MLTNKTYYEDNTYISNSMLNNFVQYNKFGNKLIMPEKYYAFHIAKTLKWEGNDDTLCGTIVDKYFGEGPYILADYPCVSKRSGNNPNEITNSMNDKIQGMIAGLKAFKSFQEYISHPDVIKGDSDKSIIILELTLPNGNIKLKGKTDFINHTTKSILDLKTTGKISTKWDEMQFKQIANIYYRDIRQMAIYNRMTGYSITLAIVDEDGNMLYIPIRQDILDKAWEVVMGDLTLLNEYYNNNWTNLIQDPFLVGNIEDLETKEIF